MMPVREAAEWQTSKNIDDRESGALKQAHLVVADQHFLTDGIHQDTEDQPIDIRNHAREAKYARHPPARRRR